MPDARFRDADGGPLRLMALDAEDLGVISALVQDAVLSGADMRWDAKGRRFDLLLNRFRWENGARAPERVRSVLTADCVLGVSSDGIARGGDAVLSLLGIAFEHGEEPGGALVLRFAGDGAIRLKVEAVEVRLSDVTRPYAAPSGRVPRHD